MVPEFLEGPLERLFAPEVLVTLAVLSAVTFVASLVGVPFFLNRLPQNYFSRRERATLGIPEGPTSRWRIVASIVRNAIGMLLLLLGLLMLVLPGQGLLTLLVGLMLVDFPGKRKLERWVIGRPSVLRTINALRRRAGRAPLESRASWLPPEPPPPG